MSGKKKKKKKRRILKLNMGDTVKLSKGRIGLIRFIGKTQFGLGEWIGVELYNELLRTRHNGAVLGKRYFRCPPHRGVFMRRSLIKENIAVLDIPKYISKLRGKEKKLKDERKKKLKKEKTNKKLKNEEKRLAKKLKVQAKYANSPKPKVDTKQFQAEKIPKFDTKNQLQTDKTKTPKSDQMQTEKIDKIKKKEKDAKYIPALPALPASFKTSSSRRKEKRNSMRKTKKNKKRQSNSKKRYSSSISNSSKKGYIGDTNDSENAYEEVPKISTKKDDKTKSFARSKKPQSIDPKKKKRNSSGSSSSDKLPKSMSPVLKTSASSPCPQVSFSPFTPPLIDDDDSLLEEASIDSNTPITRYSLSSNRSKSIDDNMDDNEMVIFQPQTQEEAQAPPLRSLSLKNKVSVRSYDGVIDSDEDSLNESEEDEDKDDDKDDDDKDREDSVLMRELEEDFENNYEKFHKVVLDDYTHTIDDIETGRKKLADKLVKDRKKRKSKEKKRSNRKRKGVGFNKHNYKEMNEMQERIIAEKNFKRRPVSPRINPTLMRAAMMNQKKQFHSARSRRGSSFVDEYNLNDTLFFDGDEETDTVQNSEQFYVDEMGSDNEENEDIPDIPEEKKEESPTAEDAVEEDEDSMTETERSEPETEPETETDVDPLLGTIDEEDDEEEMKIFDIEKDDENEKVLVFYEKLNEFLVWECGENGNGMKINKIRDNDYGNALFEETGITTEWDICIINEDDISEMGRMYINIQLRQCKKNVVNGYSLTFRRNARDINDTNNLKPSVYMKTKKNK